MIIKKGFINYLLLGISIYITNVGHAEETNSIEKICREVNTINYPKEDLPTQEDKIILKDCVSKNLYYGINIQKDYVKARKCAFIEKELKKNDKNPIFNGDSILMMLYANGYGVHKNTDLAIKSACLVATYAIDQLKEIKNNKISKDFDLCDSAADTFTLNICSDKNSEMTVSEDNFKKSAYIKSFTSEQKDLFQKLEIKYKKFFTKRIRNYDSSGSFAPICAVNEKSLLNHSFIHSFILFEQGKIPNVSEGDFLKLDKELNKVYSSILKTKDFSSNITTITLEGFRETQRAWLDYRDAWVKFASVRYPKIKSYSWKAWLTKERLNQLTKKAEEGDMCGNRFL